MIDERSVWDLLDDAPNYAEHTAKLYSWSTNWGGAANPFQLFLDLIGYSEQEFGEPMFAGSPSEVLGHLERAYLARALLESAERPSDIRDFVNRLLDAESRE